MNTGWALATIDNKTSGLIPVNYVRRVEPKSYANQSEMMNQSVIVPKTLQANGIENLMESTLNAPTIESTVDDQITHNYTNKLMHESNEIIINDDSTIRSDLKEL